MNQLVFLMVLAAGCVHVGDRAQGTQRDQGQLPEYDSLLGIEIHHSTLDDVQRALGLAQIMKCSALEGSPSELCYVLPYADNVRVVFRSGILSGREYVDEFALMSGSQPGACGCACQPSHAFTGRARIGSQLTLGMTPAEVRRILGSPMTKTRTTLTYSFATRVEMTHDEIQQAEEIFGGRVDDPYWDRIDTIEFEFDGSRVSAIAVRRTETR